ncbi:MAG: glycosyltransferase [Leptospiraceae bacterium]|nr:glycosyltransferase [Leptospiraceae bacterium]
MKIYQHVDELNDRDGIGNDIYGFHSVFEKLGFESSVVTRINNSKNTFPIHSPQKHPCFLSSDIHILHFGSTGYPLDFFEDLPGQKILRFHNMTPISFFKSFMNEDLFKTFEKNETKAHLELYSLHRSISHVISDSNYNQDEYLQIVGRRGKVRFEVIPVIRNYPLIAKTGKSGYRIGFLGRWVPNKKLEDLLFTLFFLRKIDSRYTLVLLGKKNPIFQLYNNEIQRLITKLDLGNSIEISENLTDEEVKKQLANLDIYLSMSEHEGFGIPILEAMAANVPVLAYSCSAVIETVRDAGILFTKKDFPLLAELIHKIRTSSDLKESILKTQFNRLSKYNHFPFGSSLSNLLQK